ncbi:hypothetical protein OIE66_23305 [Nonomuraea sp. NBC_01738]|uniref:hypothetical protein n=1 Tax=Nonomuraea sp. NBC_01738 TaxID=2976003 RepID=UPI002E0F88E7|nr:hypothetical protein OIE66_23305 [Nonomuraea sp. NBC_01738]
MRTRTRVLIMAGVLALVAVAGAVWLFAAATGGGSGGFDGGTAGLGEPAAGEPGPAESPGDSTAESPEESTEETAGPDGRATGQGVRPTGSAVPQGGRRSVHWNGIHLDGSAGDSGCITVINKTGMAGVIESVSFGVVSGPGRATVRLDASHCSNDGDPVCGGARLRAGSQCMAGAVLSGTPSEEAYVLQPTVRFRYLCVDVVSSPCSEVGDWGGPPPTASAPVELTGTTQDLPTTEAWIKGAPEPPVTGDTPDPEPEPAGESAGTPDDAPADASTEATG